MKRKLKVISTKTGIAWTKTVQACKKALYTNKSGLVLRVVACTTLVIVALLLTLNCAGRNGQRRLARCGEEEFNSERLSRDITYFECYDYGGNYIANERGRTIIKNIDWIRQYDINDSLVCYSTKGKCGYFHKRDGHIVVKPRYAHAWAFSDGVAAVEERGRIKFIDTAGRTVIEGRYAYSEVDDDYLFISGYCAVNDSDEIFMGLIDRSGEWALPPEYNDITCVDTLWLVEGEDFQMVLTHRLDTLIPPTHATFIIEDSLINAIFSDHTLGVYNLRGELVAASQIGEVKHLEYKTRELRYDIDNKNPSVPVQTMGVATCMLYEAEFGWYGLMSASGKIVTPPSYKDIRAVDKDLYLCLTDYGRGVLLDSNGRIVK